MAGDMELVQDELAIRRLLAQYCIHLDDGRFDDWIDLFSEDIEFVVMGHRLVGRAEVRGFIEPSQQADARGLHTISAPLLELEPGADVAVGRTDFVWFARSGEPGQVGRYHDQFVRDPDRWRFARREIVFTGDAPSAPPAP